MTAGCPQALQDGGWVAGCEHPRTRGCKLRPGIYRQVHDLQQQLLSCTQALADHHKSTCCIVGDEAQRLATGCPAAHRLDEILQNRVVETDVQCAVGLGS